MQESGSLLTP